MEEQMITQNVKDKCYIGMKLCTIEHISEHAVTLYDVLDDVVFILPMYYAEMFITRTRKNPRRGGGQHQSNE
jgi:hypothetical protein